MTTVAVGGREQQEKEFPVFNKGGLNVGISGWLRKF